MDVNGREASLRWINSFLNQTAYHLMNWHLLIFNMFYTKQYFWIELFLEFTPKQNKPFYKRSHWVFATGVIQFTALLINSYGL